MKLIGWAEPDKIEHAASLLVKACDVIDERGWNQGTIIDEETGSCCAQGAIILAQYPIDGLPYTFGFDDPTVIAVGIFQRVIGQQLPTFNDAEGRTATGVKEALRKAADTAVEEVARWRASQTPQVSER